MITHLRERSQITLPSEVTKQLNLKPGDSLDISVEDDRIVVKPVIIIDKSQAWFWSKEWLEKEKAAEEDLKSGNVNKAKDVNDLMKQLES
ncbi:MAG TPA: AbrB family transcriptional regulator [Lachnospiraceae bacterium]|nr:AbrB family transcriptional regulator [Lachnospiraceae bacterium]